MSENICRYKIILNSLKILEKVEDVVIKGYQSW